MNNIMNEDNMADKLWSRWHRYDTNNVKYIRKFSIGETPNPMQEEGFTEWFRGTGPLSKEHYEKVAEAMRRLSLGKPKSTETKSKMSMAKRGKPKSEQHKKNMSLAQRRRFQRIKNNNESNSPRIQQERPSDIHNIQLGQGSMET
jgi:hypothetical protein